MIRPAVPARRWRTQFDNGERLRIFVGWAERSFAALSPTYACDCGGVGVGAASRHTLTAFYPGEDARVIRLMAIVVALVAGSAAADEPMDCFNDETDVDRALDALGEG